MSSSRSGERVLPARPGDPKRVGPYRIIGRLGSGGMGTVHAGLDALGLRVAVKVVHSAQAEDPEFRARFRREVQLSARVQGPFLIPLLAADPDADSPWLAMAYVPGPTLDRHLATHGPLAESTLYAFATGTAQALAAIHAAGVVHRDVKPQNVILTPAGPRVLDFGIAHAADGTSVTRTGIMTGTPGWISPEYYRAGSAGPEGDLFAWGALVAYAATGRLPFGTGAPDVVAYRVMSEEPDLQGLPDELRTIVESALSKQPGSRTTASQAAEECAVLLAAQATQVIPAGAEPTLVGDLVAAEWDVPAVDDPAWHPHARSSRRMAGIAVVTGVVIGGLTGGALALQPGKTETLPSSSRHDSASSTRITDASSPASPTASPGRPDTSPSVDADEATITSWRSARRAKGEAEIETEAALGHDVGLGVGEEYNYSGQYDVTYAWPRKEIYIAISGPTVESRVIQGTAKDACLTLRMMADLYKDLPYDEYVLVDNTTTAAPAIVWEDDFRTNTGCVTQTIERSTTDQGQDPNWDPAEAGLTAAQIPSVDKDEIRVATDAVHQLFVEWNGNSRLFHDPRYISDENTSIGFAPDEGVMYVWATKPEWDQSTREDWGQTAAGVACRTILTESRARLEWRYAQYAVAVLDGAGGTDFLRWGSVGNCAS
ncbi:serine/threonine protein kinase [Streptomyces europaeiscabiei]|uniref:serine/threonine protein kinase n=1 Tax=Streptomyces europaeiscabiei TaxID=146819 RepID=UPI000E67A42C|nr:serine/threonine-protein kinase [Streptomyces europaeiscabiei]MDX3843771.1 serine/threonine-protein kinase [Streptomyces europaeiscabiei]